MLADTHTVFLGKPRIGGLCCRDELSPGSATNLASYSPMLTQPAGGGAWQVDKMLVMVTIDVWPCGCIGILTRLLINRDREIKSCVVMVMGVLTSSD